MDTKEIETHTVCETKMRISAYHADKGIVIEQLDYMQGDPAMIAVNYEDIPALVRILNMLKKEAKLANN